MRRYRNKYEQINNQDLEEHSYELPSYQISREYQHTKFPSGYEKSRHISQNMQYHDPHGNKSKISSKSEKYFTVYTESSQPKVNFESKNTAKNYMQRRAYTPSRIGNYNVNEEYISELREEYSNPMMNNRVNIRKKVYTGNKTPQTYSSNAYNEYKNENEELLENYGYHETKDIKNKGHAKYDSITHITGYSNLIPLNRLKQCGRIENYNYNSREENKPNLKNAIEKVRELQRGKREYDEFMRKLGANESNEERIENYKREQLRQQEIREEKIRMERIQQERMREERIRNEKIRQEKLRIERMKKENESKKEKIRKEQIRQEELKQIKIKEEKIRQEKLRQEKLKQDKLKQQSKLKQENVTQLKTYKEKIKDNSSQKIGQYKRIVINTQVSSNSRSDSIKKQFKAHSGKYTYKDNIDEEINHYRNNSNYKDQKNVARKETIYKSNKKRETNKSYSHLPIKININNATTSSYSRNQSSKNLKTITDYSVKNKENEKNIKNQSYIVQTKKTTITTNTNRAEGRKNSFKSNQSSINNDPNKNKNMKKYTSNYTKQSYKSSTSYSNINKNNYPNKSSNNYKRSMVNVSEKTASLNYPNPHIKSNYKGQPYHQDYVNIENVSYGKIANHIHTGLSKDGQYLINMTSAEKISDENEVYELPEKNIEEIISTVRERKKNLGDNYAFYESKHLQKPDNSSYTIHKRFGERTIFGKEKYETKKVRHYKVKPGEERKYYDITDNDIDDNNINNYNIENNQIEYRDCGYGCMQRNNENMGIRDEYENVNFNYSPDSPEGQDIQEREYENNVEEYNYEY